MYSPLLNTLNEYISLNEAEIEVIKDYFRVKRFKKGEWFVREGTATDQVGFIVTGLLFYYWNDDGDIKAFEFGQKGDFVSNYESCIFQTPSDLNIQFLEDTVLFTTSYSKLDEMFRQLNEGERFGRLILEYLFVKRVKAISSFYRHTPEMRYQHFLQTHSSILSRIPQYLIASYIGVKPQSLSRIKQRMDQDNRRS